MTDLVSGPGLVAGLPLPPPAQPPQLWSIGIEADDQLGLLSKLLAALSALQLDIRSANVQTDASGGVRNTFVVSKPSNGLKAQEVIDALTAALRA